MSHLGFESPFIKPWLCLKQDSLFFLFSSVCLDQKKNISYSCFIPGTGDFKKKCFSVYLFCSSCKLPACCDESVKSVKNNNKPYKKKGVCLLMVYTTGVSLFLALLCCNIFSMQLSNERFCIFHPGQVVSVELSWKESKGLWFPPIICPLLSLTSYPIGLLSWLMTSGC